MGFHGLLQGNLPNPGIKPLSLTFSAMAGRFFTTLATWEDLSLKGYISRKILKITGPLHFFFFKFPLLFPLFLFLLLILFLLLLPQTWFGKVSDSALICYTKGARTNVSYLCFLAKCIVCSSKQPIQEICPGISLVVQWLRLCAPKARRLVLIPGQGTTSYMLQLKIPHATTKTWCSQINK